jgi:rubrerythrin
MQEQMNDTIEEMGEVGVNDEEIIHVALELEAHSRYFYEKTANKSSNKVVKNFYNQLALEEKSHQELLQKTNQYLANPSLFFGMDGR